MFNKTIKGLYLHLSYTDLLLLRSYVVVVAVKDLYAYHPTERHTVKLAHKFKINIDRLSVLHSASSRSPKIII